MGEAGVRPSGDAPESLGRIIISERALSDIVGWTVLESYGVVGMASPNLYRGVARILTRDKLHQGIRLEEHDSRLRIDLYIVVEYGLNVAEVAGNVRSQVLYNIRRMTGRRVDEIHIHVQGVRVGNH
ncbi:MAG: Asp23/Gls24 family envelope stress response protein [Thermoleophilia bacterium]